MKTTKIIVIAVLSVLFLACAGVLVYFALNKRALADNYTRANAAYQAGDYREAIARLSSVLMQDPDNEDAYRLLAQSAQGDNNYRVAAFAWTKAAYLNPLDKKLAAARDEAHLAAGTPNAVLDFLAVKMQNETASDDEKLRYARALIATGDMKSAREIVDALPASDSVPYRLARAQLALADGRDAEARDVFLALTDCGDGVAEAHAFIGLATLALRDKKDADALQYLLQADKACPAAAAAPLARYYMATGRLAEAVPALKLTIDNSGSAEALADLVDAYAGLKDVAALKDIAARMAPDNRTLAEIAFYAEALAAYLENDTDKVRRNLELCPSCKSRNLYRLMDLQGSLAGDDVAHIRDAAQAMMSTDITSAKSRAMLVQMLAPAMFDAVKNRQLAKADALATLIEPIAGDDKSVELAARKTRMLCAWEQNDPAPALVSALVVLHGAPDDLQANEIAARAHTLLGRPEQSLPYYETLARLQPNEPRFLAGRAVALDAKGDENAAAASFEAAWRIDPANEQAILNYGHYLLSKKRVADFAAFLERLRAEKAPVPRALAGFLAAQACELKDDTAGAVAHYKAAIACAPDMPLCYLALSQVLPAKEGIALMEDALTRFPKNAAVRYRLAYLLARVDDNARADALYAALLEDNPEWDLALVNRSEVLAALGKKAEALACAQKAATLYPNWGIGQYCLGMRLAESGDTAAAVKTLTPLFEKNPKDARLKTALESALRAEVQIAKTRDDIYRQRDALKGLLKIKPDDRDAAAALEALEAENR